MVDVDRVRNAASIGGREVDLLLQDLLEDWTDWWVRPFRFRWRQTRLHAIEATCRRLIDEGRNQEAACLADRILRSEPLRESTVRLRVEADIHLGRPAAATATASAYKARLEKEMWAKASPWLAEVAGRLGN